MKRRDSRPWTPSSIRLGRDGVSPGISQEYMTPLIGEATDDRGRGHGSAADRAMEYKTGRSGLWYPHHKFELIVEAPINLPEFAADCADFGLVREVFAPGIGLIERTVVSLRGEETWSLAYAEVGGRVWGATPNVSTEGDDE